MGISIGAVFCCGFAMFGIMVGVFSVLCTALNNM